MPTGIALALIGAVAAAAVPARAAEQRISATVAPSVGVSLGTGPGLSHSTVRVDVKREMVDGVLVVTVSPR